MRVVFRRRGRTQNPVALAIEPGPPSCSITGVTVFILFMGVTVKMKVALPENSIGGTPSLNPFLLGPHN